MSGRWTIICKRKNCNQSSLIQSQSLFVFPSSVFANLFVRISTFNRIARRLIGFWMSKYFFASHSPYIADDSEQEEPMARTSGPIGRTQFVHWCLTLIYAGQLHTNEPICSSHFDRIPIMFQREIIARPSWPMTLYDWQRFVHNQSEILIWHFDPTLICHFNGIVAFDSELVVCPALIISPSSVHLENAWRLCSICFDPVSLGNVCL